MRGARLDYIDTIRGLSALAVIYYHCSKYLLSSGQDITGLDRVLFVILTEYVDIGKVGVVMFFAVSGFVIPYSLDANGQSPTRDFVISRLFRLYPAYWLSVIAGIYTFYIAQSRGISLTTVIANFTMLQQFVGFENVIGLYWTLQIEIIFYVLCVALLWSGLLQRTTGLSCAAAAMLMGAFALAIARFYLARAFPVALPLSLAVMFWGALWRRWQVERQTDARRASLFILALIVLTVPLISALAYRRDVGFGQTWYLYATTYWASLLIFVLMTTICKVEGRIFAWFGTVSYALYLFGPIAQEIVIAGAHSIGIARHGHVVIAATMIVAIAFAAPIHSFVERPCIRLGRRVVMNRNHVVGPVQGARSML